MRAARLVLLGIAVLGAVLATSASARASRHPDAASRIRAAPQRHAVTTFSRTPAFAWNPVRGASCYEFELATSRSFNGSSVIWSNVSTDAQLRQALHARQGELPSRGHAGRRLEAAGSQDGGSTPTRWCGSRSPRSGFRQRRST